MEETFVDPFSLLTVMVLSGGLGLAIFTFSCWHTAKPLALFWESYGFSPDNSVQFQLRVNRNDEVNLARRPQRAPVRPEIDRSSPREAPSNARGFLFRASGPLFL